MLKEKLQKDLLEAMKNKDKDTLNTLRSVKGAVQLEVINNKKEDNDDLVLDVITKQIKMRKESIKDFEKASRTDLINSYQKEIDIIESKKQAIQRRIKAIEEIKDIDITDESEKYDILHKVIEAIKIYSVKTNQKVFTVLFASGLEYNVLYNVNKPKFRIEYAFASDETITFNKKDKLLINKLHSSVRDILPDFSITAGNNDMFDNDVCGDYSFQEVWDLLEKYNKTEVLREWKPDYTKRTINRRSKK